MTTRWRHVLFGMVIGALLSSCNSGTEPSIPAEVRFDTSTIAFSAFEQAQQITPKVFDQRGYVMNDATITWQSANDAVASVTNGLVKANGVGSTMITASVGAASANAIVTVVQAPTMLQKISGEFQSGLAGSMLPVPLTVEATDANLNPIAGAKIEFIANGNVTFHTPIVTTGIDGRASSMMTVRRSGTFQVFAVVADIEADVFATFELSGTAGPASQVLIVHGNNPTVRPSTELAPLVLIADAYGNGIPGIPFRVDVTAGGGNVGAPGSGAAATYSGTSGLDGQVDFAWYVGAAGEQRVRISTPGASLAGSPTTLSVMVTNGFISPYDINVSFISPATTNQALAFAAAERRWERHIVGDLSSHTLSLPTICGDGRPGFSGEVDDLQLFVEIVPIDGPGNVLGSAGPCAIRTSNDLPLIGIISLDVDDVATMETAGILQDVVLHEMGHVLGIGSLWQHKNLLAGPSRTGGTDPHFIGSAAISAFDAAGGWSYSGQRVPVENGGGAGTADSHWRESVLNNELMTGYVNTGANPLSAITIRSLQDLGYAVDASGADGFTVGQALRAPGGTPVRLKDDVRRGTIQRVN